MIDDGSINYQIQLNSKYMVATNNYISFSVSNKVIFTF